MRQYYWHLYWDTINLLYLYHLYLNIETPAQLQVWSYFYKRFDKQEVNIELLTFFDNIGL